MIIIKMRIWLTVVMIFYRPMIINIVMIMIMMRKWLTATIMTNIFMIMIIVLI